MPECNPPVMDPPLSMLYAWNNRPSVDPWREEGRAYQCPWSITIQASSASEYGPYYSPLDETDRGVQESVEVRSVQVR